MSEEMEDRMEERQGAEVAGRVIVEEVLQPGADWAMVIRQGQRLRIVDLEGKQAVDFLCYNAQAPEERYNAADTMKYAGTIFLTKGHALWSDLGRKLFTIVEDTCGRHDTIGGCCSAESNLVRYGVAGTPNCREAVETRGLRRSARGDGRPGRRLQLPPDPQPLQRLQPHPDQGHRLRACRLSRRIAFSSDSLGPARDLKSEQPWHFKPAFTSSCAEQPRWVVLVSLSFLAIPPGKSCAPPVCD